MVEKGISKQEEEKLPAFQSHEKAIDYFEAMYGEKFVFEEAIETSDGTCFFYRLITDEEAYIIGVTALNSTGYVGVEFMKSYQPIKILEDGSITIVR